MYCHTFITFNPPPSFKIMEVIFGWPLARVSTTWKKTPEIIKELYWTWIKPGILKESGKFLWGNIHGMLFGHYKGFLGQSSPKNSAIPLLKRSLSCSVWILSGRKFYRFPKTLWISWISLNLISNGFTYHHAHFLELFKIWKIILDK